MTGQVGHQTASATSARSYRSACPGINPYSSLPIISMDKELLIYRVDYDYDWFYHNYPKVKTIVKRGIFYALAGVSDNSGNMYSGNLYSGERHGAV